MNVEDLQEQLMQLGRRPVPGPRPEFVETLLARIQLPDESLPLAPVLSLSSRRPMVRRMALLGAAGALAAASLAAVAISSIDDDPTEGVEVIQISTGRDLIWSVDLVGINGKRAMGCPEDGSDIVLGLADGQIGQRCEPGMEVRVSLDHGRLTASPKLEMPSSTTAVQRFVLTVNAGSGSADLAWDAYAGANFGSYVVLRKQGEGVPTLGSDTKVASITDKARSNFTESVTAAAPDGETVVSYLVIVLDPAGKPIGRSLTIRVPILYSDNASTNG